MPCNCDHLEVTYDEMASKKVCQHICFLFSQLGKHIPEWVKNGSSEYYGVSSKLAEAEAMLYETIIRLNDDALNAYVYNGKSKNSRVLANWYDDFAKNYNTERKRKKRKAEIEKRAKSILAKLRKDEVEIVRNYLTFTEKHEGKL